MSKLKELAQQVIMNAMNGIQNSYAEMLAEQTVEMIEGERKQMPTAYGYTRERALIGRCRSACSGYPAVRNGLCTREQ